LEVDIGGDREDLLEIVVDAQVLESYGIDFDQMASLVTRNNLFTVWMWNDEKNRIIRTDVNILV